MAPIHASSSPARSISEGHRKPSLTLRAGVRSSRLSSTFLVPGVRGVALGRESHSRTLFLCCPGARFETPTAPPLEMRDNSCPQLHGVQADAGQLADAGQRRREGTLLQ